MDARRILSAGIALAAAASVAACGDDAAQTATTQRTAKNVHELAQRLTAYTGVVAEAAESRFLYDEVRMTDDVGAQRFGAPRIAWTKDDEQREDALGADEPADDGWYVSEGGERLAMAFGPHLVLRGFDLDHEPGRPPDLQAAARALRAAYEGRPELLPEAERSCELQQISPLRDASGACALDGIPTTFVSAPRSLRTDALEATVTGVETTDVLDAGGLVPERAGAGQRFVVVGFRLTNRTHRALVSDMAALRVGEGVYELDRRASGAAGRYVGSVPPGGRTELAAVFRLSHAAADRARSAGVLVIPTGLRSTGLLNDVAGQGWIRLDGAPSKLPGAASPSAPQNQGPPGPPKIPVRDGGGMAYGAAARAAYHASMFFPVPANFRRGPVRAGTVAGACTVPALTDTDRAQLADMARAAYPKDRLHRILDRSILLAECGPMGDVGIVFWGHDRNGRSTISGVEVVRRGGRWVEREGRFPPGCTVPLDAAAAWQIDVSPCPKDAPRPHPDGDLS